MTNNERLMLDTIVAIKLGTFHILQPYYCWKYDCEQHKDAIKTTGRREG